MRIALLIVVALALVLSASAALAAVNQADGWAGSPSAGYLGELSGDYQTNWSTAGTGTSSWTGWWDADDNGWVPAAGGGGDDGLKVTAYVELYASQTQVNEAIFHWGTPPFVALNVDLNGTIVSNHPCWVGIRKAGWQEADVAKASKLSLSGPGGRDFWGRTTGVSSPNFPGVSTGDSASDIPIAFSMSVGPSPFYAMDWSGGVGSANWGWYSPGRLPVGTTNYQFRITATPSPYQSDGKYTLDPQVIVVPEL
jgi:hypothetical protein